MIGWDQNDKIINKRKPRPNLNTTNHLGAGELIGMGMEEIKS